MPDYRISDSYQKLNMPKKELGSVSALESANQEDFNLLIRSNFFGRDGEIRTPDPLNPIQVRYQTALRPDRWGKTIL